MKRRQIERMVGLGAGISLCMLLVVIALVWHSIREADEASAVVRRSNQVLHGLEQALLKSYRLEHDWQLAPQSERARVDERAALREIDASVDAALQLGSTPLARLGRAAPETPSSTENDLLHRAALRHAGSSLPPSDMALLRGEIEMLMAGENERLRSHLSTELADHRTMYARFAAMLGTMAIGAGFLFLRIRSVSRAGTAMAAALRHGEARYRSIVETASEGICIVDSWGKIVLANSRLADMFGCTREDLVDASMSDFMDARARRAILPVVARSRAGAGGSIDFRFRRRDGSVLWVLLSTQPFKDDSGDFAGALAMLADITERKSAVEALRKSHEELELRVRQRYADLMEVNAALTAEVAEHLRTGQALHESQRFAHAIIDALPAQILVLDREGRIVAVNRAVRQLSPDYEMGANYLQLGRARIEGGRSGSPALLDGIAQVIAGEKREVVAEYACRQDGRERWFWVRAGRFDGETPLRLVVAQVDITEQKRNEAALRASEERFYSLAAMSSDWFWEQDAEFRFTLVSGGAQDPELEVAGQVIGKTRWEIAEPMPESDWQAHRAVLEEHGRFTNFEYRYSHGKFGERWLSVSGEPVFDAEGVFRGYRGTGHDITERKQIEQVLRQSQDALRQLAAYQERIKEEERKRIAREIHDELGSMLTGIKAYVSVSIDRAERAGAQPDPLLGEAVKLTETAIETVRRVISDLRPSMLDQLGIWPALEWHVGEVARRTGLRCDYVVDAGAEPVELGPERSIMLFRIVQEALTNVVRHAQATRVTIRAFREESYIMVEIADNGKGMDQDPVQNSGSWGVLGMYERAHHFGGELVIAGTKGEGTKVSLRLPMENVDG